MARKKKPTPANPCPVLLRVDAIRLAAIAKIRADAKLIEAGPDILLAMQSVLIFLKQELGELTFRLSGRALAMTSNVAALENAIRKGF